MAPGGFLTLKIKDFGLYASGKRSIPLSLPYNDEFVRRTIIKDNENHPPLPPVASSQALPLPNRQTTGIEGGTSETP
jgi:hypothetical protein